MKVQTLVDGYTMRNEKGLEILFAIYPNGIIKTCTRKFSTSFNNEGDVWTTIDRENVNEEAEYCGRYYMD